MDARSVIVSLRHGGTQNNRRTLSPIDLQSIPKFSYAKFWPRKLSSYGHELVTEVSQVRALKPLETQRSVDDGREYINRTATAGSDVVQSGRPIFDDFFQHLWPYIGNNTANVVFQMVKRLWLIRIDQ
ncbi:hypothetical protein TNCV_2858281 [Trichonephila clavipes]|nr:hypothetical protein TNCV_2858281 [Trichonephila clavipes]